MSMSIIIVFYLISSSICGAQIPTIDDINDLRFALRQEYDASGRFRDLLSATVRLIFHDCAGPDVNNSSIISICNGCIDWSNEDHDGLIEKAVQPLNQLYAAWRTKIGSRADFWAAAATIALEHAAELASISNPTDTFPIIPFYFGRIDCSSPIGDAQNTKVFVSADDGWIGISDWFRQHLGYTDEEIVTIIGAHTLGRAHASVTGYSSLPWVSIAEGPEQLNNNYYKTLLSVSWFNQQSVKGKWEWRNNAATNRLQMLRMNADMSLILDFDRYLDTSTGKVSCPGGICPVNSNILAIVQQFAAQNQLFLDKFAAVFEKLIKTGYSDNELTVLTAAIASDGGTTAGKSPQGRKFKSVSAGNDSKVGELEAQKDDVSVNTEIIIDAILWGCVVIVMVICVLILVYMYRFSVNTFDLMDLHNERKIIDENDNDEDNNEEIDNEKRDKDNPERLITVSTVSEIQN